MWRPLGLFVNSWASDILENKVGVIAATFRTFYVNIAASAESFPHSLRTAALLESSWECLSFATALSLCCTHHLSVMSFYWQVMTFNYLQVPLYSHWLSKNLRIKIRRYLSFVGNVPWFRLLVASLSLRARSRAGLWDFRIGKWDRFFSVGVVPPLPLSL